EPFTIYVNDVPYSIEPTVLRNGQKCKLTDLLQDRDKIQLKRPQTIAEVLDLIDYSAKIKPHIYHLLINGQAKRLEIPTFSIFLHDEPIDLHHIINQGDRITLIPTLQENVTARSIIADEIASLPTITIMFNGKPLSIPLHKLEMLVNNVAVHDWDQHLENGDVITLNIAENRTQPVYHDIFLYTTIEQPKLNGVGQIQTLINGEHADFQSVIQNGDDVQLLWQIDER